MPPLSVSPPVILDDPWGLYEDRLGQECVLMRLIASGVVEVLGEVPCFLVTPLTSWE